MDANLTTAIISACATALVAIVAIMNNNKRLDDMNGRIGDLNQRLTQIDNRFLRLETRLDTIGHMLAGYAVDVARIKEKLGIS